MKTVLIHPLAGILSAYGMGLADIRANRSQAIERVMDEAAMAEIRAETERLGEENLAELESQGIARQAATTIRRVHLRYAGTDTPLTVELASPEAMRAAFETAHKQQFGFVTPQKAIVVEAVEVESLGGGSRRDEPDHPLTDAPPYPVSQTRFFSGGQWRDAPVFDLERLKPGQRVPGPALIVEAHNTIVVEDGWQAEITPRLHLVMTRIRALPRRTAIGTEADPVMLEVFNNLFMSIAEQMGVTLEKTAYSVNIKERLDFSCAVFAPDGSLIANAPHMPVHLGSMDRSVQAVIEQNPEIRAGDVFVLNAPYNGGTHLPDITVVTPVFDAAGTRSCSGSPAAATMPMSAAWRRAR
jgi:5-oxoprolinase (ATP-hydrolysing)